MHPGTLATMSQDAWVICYWHCYHDCRLFGLVGIDGKPRPDYQFTSTVFEMYKWFCYHSARKYQRAHPELAGYVLFNLSQAIRIGRKVAE